MARASCVGCGIDANNGSATSSGHVVKEDDVAAEEEDDIAAHGVVKPTISANDAANFAVKRCALEEEDFSFAPRRRSRRLDDGSRS